MGVTTADVRRSVTLPPTPSRQGRGDFLSELPTPDTAGSSQTLLLADPPAEPPEIGLELRICYGLRVSGNLYGRGYGFHPDGRR